MEIKVLAEQLEHGMFVQELDRPWLDTPFLLQGFVIESDRDLAELRKYCRYVIADVERSTGAGRETLESMAGPMKPVSRERDVASADRSPRPAAKVVRLVAGTSSQVDVKAFIAEQKLKNAGAQRPPEHASAAPPVQGGDDDAARKDRPLAVADATLPGMADVPSVAEDLRAIGIGLVAQVTGRVRDLFGGRRLSSAPERKREAPIPQARELAAERVYESPPVMTVIEDRVVVSPALRRAHEAKRLSHDAVAQFLADLRQKRKPDLVQVDEAVNDLVGTAIESPDALMWLTQLKRKDAYTYERSIDVSIHMLVFGRHLGYPRSTLHTLGLAGLMLDVGKLKLPDALLEKKGRLSDAEFALMRRHVQFGLDYLEALPGMPPEVIDIVAKHHERHDGSGYPHRLSGDQIGALPTIAAIVDCFNALTVERPYATAMSTHQALGNLYNWRGQLFQEGLVEQFIRCIGAFPVGTLVEMNTGEVGVVIAQNKVLKLKPKVMLLLDRVKQAYRTPVVLDLMTDPRVAGDLVYRIARDVPVGLYDIDPREFYV